MYIYIYIHIQYADTSIDRWIDRWVGGLIDRQIDTCGIRDHPSPRLRSGALFFFFPGLVPGLSPEIEWLLVPFYTMPPQSPGDFVKVRFCLRSFTSRKSWFGNLVSQALVQVSHALTGRQPQKILQTCRRLSLRTCVRGESDTCRRLSGV